MTILQIVIGLSKFQMMTSKPTQKPGQERDAHECSTIRPGFGSGYLITINVHDIRPFVKIIFRFYCQYMREKVSRLLKIKIRQQT